VDGVVLVRVYPHDCGVELVKVYSHDCGVVLLKMYSHDCMASAGWLWLAAFQCHILNCRHLARLNPAHAGLSDAAGFPDSTLSVNATWGFERSDYPWHVFSGVHGCENHQTYNLPPPVAR